jgi:hypothetical protein
VGDAAAAASAGLVPAVLTPAVVGRAVSAGLVPAVLTPAAVVRAVLAVLVPAVLTPAVLGRAVLAGLVPAVLTPAAVVSVNSAAIERVDSVRSIGVSLTTSSACQPTVECTPPAIAWQIVLLPRG